MQVLYLLLLLLLLWIHGPFNLAVASFFYGVRLLALRPTPNLEEQSPEFMSLLGPGGPAITPSTGYLRYLESATSRAHLRGPRRGQLPVSILRRSDRLS
jgi:hypothetical protein